MNENNTYNEIIDCLHCTTRLWDKVSKDLSKISVKLVSSKKNDPEACYGIFYNGVFTGCFIDKRRINLEELPQCGWKFEGNAKLFG